MKRGTPTHPKTIRLAEQIRRRWPMPEGMAENAACGLVEKLWHYVARYAPQGDVQRHGLEPVIRAVGWPVGKSVAKSGDELVSVLVDTGWLVRGQGNAVFVHDWSHHAGDSVRKTLERRGMRFWDEATVRRTKEDVATAARNVATETRPLTPSPSPSPPPRRRDRVATALPDAVNGSGRSPDSQEERDAEGRERLKRERDELLALAKGVE